MIIEKYIVRDMAEAFERGKASLGDDAILLTQRIIRQKGFWGFFKPKQLEVTMAIEQRPINKKSVGAVSTAGLSAKTPLPQIQEDLWAGSAAKDSMLTRELESIEEFRRFASVNRLATMQDLKLKNMLIRHFLQETLDQLTFSDIVDSGCVAFVGSTGVGKTTTIAKIAAHAKLKHSKKVGLITIDTYRIGAVEQLKIYADIMDLSMITVMTPIEMKPSYLKLSKTCDLILIDTLGTSYRNQQQIEDISRYLNEIEHLNKVAVVPATLDLEIFEKTLDTYREIGIDCTILTKLDEMDNQTRLFSYVRRMSEPLAYITTGQNVPDDLVRADSKALLSYLWEGVEHDERPSA